MKKLIPEENTIHQKLLAFRHELHQHPEVSGSETETAGKILAWVRSFNPDEIITGLGGNGLAAIFQGKAAGPTILFRAELDALPIQESASHEYRSQNSNTAHLCGHDGHMAILLGLAALLDQNRPLCGKIVLLFQPAEETGTGAFKVVNDARLKPLNPDYVFAIHNLPGFELNQVIIRSGTFAAASTGMIIIFKGFTSHAAEPEKGRSPTRAVAKLLDELERLPEQMLHLQRFAMLTVVHVKIGEQAFGTTPGEAVVMATLRAFEDNDLEKLKNRTEILVKSLADNERLGFELSYTEEFPATNNHSDATDLVVTAATNLGFDILMLDEPFRWSEDFGHFTRHSKGTLIGLGAGINHPALHNPDYDFPDELINTGAKLLLQLCVEAGLL